MAIESGPISTQTTASWLAPEQSEAALLTGWLGRLGSSAFLGWFVFLLIAVPCVVTLPWSLSHYDQINTTEGAVTAAPTISPRFEPMGTDTLGRSLLWRCLLGGAISLGIGMAAAAISVGIGVVWGAVAGFAGGRTDAVLMRIVDVLYGLPYVLLVVLVGIALRPLMLEFFGETLRINANTATAMADILSLLIAIGGVSWLTMARVIRGQVLSLKAQPFIEAARACSVGPVRIFVHHLLPNLLGPIIVYATLTVPVAILQESFLSFLGLGVRAPLPSWGNLAADGVVHLHALGQAGASLKWWMIVWPCTLLALTLLALNFLGDALRARFDPRRIR